ncbi:hypothetical protein RHGRI_033337 [Rhododendron griersonianum]|uniref:non-specific serine/threonine protein kinase n=1 Tax=Rhododendron griersonianum TaxID=479676 RepID=A0AAV6I0K4_9ERIC|nr:hypothetical protein RHGRI_033337 [Rhododendron griersonianum]
MGLIFNTLLLILCLIPSSLCQVKEFISIDCGGTGNYTDQHTRLEWISDTGIMSQGKPLQVDNPNGDLQPQYITRRDFPVDDKKYCYTLSTEERRRYLVRATFLYGTSANEDTYPKFLLYLDATRWATVTVQDASRVYVKEMIIRAPSDSIDVCLCCATTGSPFISTLELRRLNLSMYATDFEDGFYLKVAARVNFGAASKEAVRLNLEDFPANARAFAYFAEIESLGANETRKFKMAEPYMPDYSNAVVNIAENANGSYTLYEPSYMNVTLDFVLTFSFRKTMDSNRGPLLNAIEISKYVQIGSKADEQDVNVLNALRTMSAESVQTSEGDPCVPAPWEWVTCSSNIPPRITKIMLSGKNMQGEIPSGLENMDALTELWLDGNSLTGSIPDMSRLVNIKIVHLENNKLSGPLPSYFGRLPSLQELYVQNNSLSGKIPPALLAGNVTFNYKGNPGLSQKGKHKAHYTMILGISIGILAIIAFLLLGSLLLLRYLRKKSYQRNESLRISNKPSSSYSIARGGHLMDEGVAIFIPLYEIEEATDSFSKKIGKGSFGPVYYGRMKDGKEVAVKTMADSTSHGTKQFVTEVALLSRIHHRNLVPLIGYCEEANQRMLVYEYMHNDSGKHKHLDWLARLHIAEDAAKGLEYLHTGCNPSIIHRDVKTSNILLDVHMRAKVSDFGLSRQAEEDLTHISSVARGTVGYLDPEYYANQQLTEKSDVYSFGVVLLELISGRKPVSTENYGPEWNIVHWARSLIRKGDVISIIDPTLTESVKIESVWRVAEVAIQCVEKHGYSRPRMQEIITAIQDAIKIEEGNEKLSPGSSKAPSARRTLLTSFLDIESPDLSNGCLHPSAR